MNVLEDGNYTGIPQKVEQTDQTYQSKAGKTMYKWNMEIEINGIRHEGQFSTTKPDKAPFEVGREAQLTVKSYNGNLNFSYDYSSKGSFKGGRDEDRTDNRTALMQAFKLVGKLNLTDDKARAEAIIKYANLGSEWLNNKK